MKKFIGIILSVIMIFSCLFVSTSFAENEISVVINGQKQTYDQMPVMINDRVLVPMRAIFETLGAEISWNNTAQIVVGKKDDILVSLTIGEKSAYVNSKEFVLDVAPTLINDRTMVPVRFVSETLGADVSWDDKTQSVIINTAYELKTDSARTFDNETSFDLDSAFTTGGEADPKAVMLSSDYDHTTGTGKSIKFGNIKKKFNRIKLPGYFSPSDIGKKFTISVWLYSPEKDTTIGVGTYGSNGSEHSAVPVIYKTVDVVHGRWVNLKFDYTHGASDVTSIGFDQKSDPFSDVFYIDDLSVTSSDGTSIVGNQTISGSTNENTDSPSLSGALNINFDNLASFALDKDFITGGEADPKGIVLSSLYDHTTGNGKCLEFGNRTKNYSRTKFLNAFSPDNVGKKYKVTVWVMVPDKDTKVSVGTYGISGTEYSAKPMVNHVVDVKKGEWTKVEFDYNHASAIITCLGVDQPNSEIAGKIYIDDINVSLKQ